MPRSSGYRWNSLRKTFIPDISKLHKPYLMKPAKFVIICAAFPFLTGTASALTPFSDNFNAASLSKSAGR